MFVPNCLKHYIMYDMRVLLYDMRERLYHVLHIIKYIMRRFAPKYL